MLSRAARAGTMGLAAAARRGLGAGLVVGAGVLRKVCVVAGRGMSLVLGGGVPHLSHWLGSYLPSIHCGQPSAAGRVDLQAALLAAGVACLLSLAVSRCAGSCAADRCRGGPVAAFWVVVQVVRFPSGSSWGCWRCVRGKEMPPLLGAEVCKPLDR